MKEAQGMKWFKFLIYFALFASAVGFVLSGVISVVWGTYSILGISSALVLDIFYGVCMFGMGILAIITRFRLAKFKKDGLVLIFLLYLIGFIITLTYLIAGSYIIQASLFSVQMIINLTYQVLLLQANYIYFLNRREMFN